MKAIDRLRKIDVPWIKYIILFSLLMTGSIVACFFALSMLRIAQSTLIPICVFFLIGLAAAFVFITFLAIQQEEIQDCQKLTDLQNKIRVEQDS